jgi:TonB family protein
VGTAVVHLIAITLLFTIKGGPAETPPPEREYVEHVTKLYVPKELTQKAPNHAPVEKLMLSKPAAPSPKLPTPAPQLTKGAAPKPPAPVPLPVAPPPPPPVVQQAPTPVETARNQAPPPAPAPVAVPKPEPPKMIVEDSLQANPQPQKAGPKLLAPTTDPISEAMRTRGAGTSSTRLGDSEEMSVGAGLHLPASAARLSNFELKSDPMGVDFWPYLQRVLAAVKLNWSAVYPQAARLGLRGQVTLEFSVRKDGLVDKITWGEHSGSTALDNAAVAAVSASEHLPPLPAEFKGDRIVLRMSFMYNMPR